MIPKRREDGSKSKKTLVVPNMIVEEEVLTPKGRRKVAAVVLERSGNHTLTRIAGLGRREKGVSCMLSDAHRHLFFALANLLLIPTQWLIMNGFDNPMAKGLQCSS